jgi:hypothetical protein
MAEEKPPAEGSGKRPYSRPEVRRVKMRPEEAVLGGCKTNMIAGPGNANCTTVACFISGS